jgi:hypothetical protein
VTQVDTYSAKVMMYDLGLGIKGSGHVTCGCFEAECLCSRKSLAARGLEVPPGRGKAYSLKVVLSG